MSKKLTTKIIVTIIISAIVPTIIVGSVSIILFQNAHNKSYSENMQYQLQDAENHLAAIVNERSYYYDKNFEIFKEKTLSQINFLENAYSNRANYGNYTTYWDDNNETGAFSIDPLSCSCVHIAINSTNSIKVNETGSFLVTLDSQTNTTDYQSTNTPYALNNDINQSIYQTAPLDLFWNSTIQKESLILYSYFGSETGIHRSFPWHWMNENTKIYDPRTRDWYISGSQQPKHTVSVSSPYTDWSTGKTTITFTTPFFYEDKLLGVIANDVLINTIIQNIFEPLVYESGNQFLIDKNAMLIARSNITDVNSPIWDETFRINSQVQPMNNSLNSEFNQAINSKLNQPDESQSFEITKIDFSEGGTKYLALISINSTNWIYGFVVSVDEILAQLNESENVVKTSFNDTLVIINIILVSIILIALTSALIISKKIKSQISKLESATQKISDGKFDLDLDIQAKDEFGSLAKSFQKMADETGDKIRSIFQIIPFGIAFFNLKGKIIIFNELFQIFINQCVHNPIELNTIEGLDSVPDCKLTQAIKQSIIEASNKSTLSGFEITIESEEKVFLKISSFHSNAGNLITIQDVSEYINFQRLQNEFVSNISHELRTPITAINLSMSNLVEFNERLNENDKNRLINHINANVTILSELIEDLLVESQFEAERFEFIKEKYNPAEIIQISLYQFEKRLQEKNITVKLDLKNDLQLMGDTKRIGQCIRIFLDNSIKYSIFKEEGKTVSISITDHYKGKYNPDDRDGILITLKDQGIGIPKNELSKLFNRFYRASNTIGISGTGLGLDIAKKIIEIHKGQLFIESELNIGTSILIFLPYIDS